MSTMNAFDLLFGAGPALVEISKMGFRPKEDDFLEMTPEQYKKFYENEKDTGEKVYLYLPKNPKEYNTIVSESEVIVVTEGDIDMFRRGWQIVENYCAKKGRENASDDEKLACAAAFLPEVFTKGTRFEKYHRSHMYPIKSQEAED